MNDTPARSHPVDRDALVTALRRVLPTDAVLDDPEDLRPYECDGLSAYRQLPLAVALPADDGEVAAALTVCREHGAPVVARGSGTSLSGGALPHPDGVVLSLARLNRILEIDPLNRTARVQPGVRNLAISEAAQPHGLYYAPDPSSQIICSIGGNVAENAGGVHCLKYGLTVHNILALEVLTIDGERLTLGGAAPDFGSIPEAGDAVSRIIAAGITPGGLEMMDGPAIKAAEDFVHAGYPTDAAAILLCELDGTVEEVDAQIEQVRELMTASGASEVRVARDEAERAAFWGRPHLTRLLLHGRHHPTPPPGACARRHHRAVGRVRAAGRQRLPRR
jgi:glycolate oxidase